MADYGPVSIVKDMANDLVHHVYNSVTGKLSAPSAPSKPASSSQDSGDWVQRAKLQAQRDRQKAIDDQVAENGG